MIKLQRGSKPHILTTKEPEWLSILKAEMANGKTVNQTSVSTNYNHPDIKIKIADCTHHKCMYCESKIKHVDHGEIEHIKPKSPFSDLIFDWENFGFTCSVCNKNKGNFYSPTNPIVDPYSEEPSDFLIALGAFIFSKAGSDRGKITQSKLDLNRTELIEQREDKINEIQVALDRFARVSDSDVRKALHDELKKFLEDKSEYAFVGRAAYKTLMS
ncbi:MAG: HNH endonuclease signature motif containing protein [Pseudobdellovibrionaceae bacterium]